MRPNHFLYLFTALTFFSFKGEEKTAAGIIEWNPQRALAWTDFSGKPDPKSSFDAWTYAGLNYSYSWYYSGNEIKVDLETYAYFDPAQSWVKKGKMSADLLEHEQIHFDIAELHVRYFKETVHSFQFTKNIESEIDSLYDSIFERMLAMQIKYDAETDHYKNKEGQTKWAQFMKEELQRLE